MVCSWSTGKIDIASMNDRILNNSTTLCGWLRKCVTHAQRNHAFCKANFQWIVNWQQSLTFPPNKLVHWAVATKGNALFSKEKTWTLKACFVCVKIAESACAIPNITEHIHITAWWTCCRQNKHVATDADRCNECLAEAYSNWKHCENLFQKLANKSWQQINNFITHSFVSPSLWSIWKKHDLDKFIGLDGVGEPTCIIFGLIAFFRPNKGADMFLATIVSLAAIHFWAFLCVFFAIEIQQSQQHKFSC